MKENVKRAGQIRFLKEKATQKMIISKMLELCKQLKIRGNFIEISSQIMKLYPLKVFAKTMFVSAFFEYSLRLD